MITLTVWKMAAVFLEFLMGEKPCSVNTIFQHYTGLDPAYATEMRMVEDHYSKEVIS